MPHREKIAANPTFESILGMRLSLVTPQVPVRLAALFAEFFSDGCRRQGMIFLPMIFGCVGTGEYLVAVGALCSLSLFDGAPFHGMNIVTVLGKISNLFPAILARGLCMLKLHMQIQMILAGKKSPTQIALQVITILPLSLIIMDPHVNHENSTRTENLQKINKNKY